jgi:archaellum component FlaF (FlaF/FlaG flagellin family)
MWKRIIKNRKGTAEVIGTIMFIVILLFFFTNVYLWHDAATKEMNDMYVEKINTPITVAVSLNAGGSLNLNYLNVTNKGGTDAQLTMLWVDLKSGSGGPDQMHSNYTPSSIDVPAGSSILILSHYSQGKVSFKVVTTLGNSASCTYSPSP